MISMCVTYPWAKYARRNNDVKTRTHITSENGQNACGKLNDVFGKLKRLSKVRFIHDQTLLF